MLPKTHQKEKLINFGKEDTIIYVYKLYKIDNILMTS